MTRRATPPPATPPPTRTLVPPPASWLRGAGLIACGAVLAADVAWDHRLDGGVWAYLAAFLVAVYGPELLLAAPGALKALFGRGGS